MQLKEGTLYERERERFERVRSVPAIDIGKNMCSYLVSLIFKLFDSC